MSVLQGPGCQERHPIPVFLFQGSAFDFLWVSAFIGTLFQVHCAENLCVTPCVPVQEAKARLFTATYMTNDCISEHVPSGKLRVRWGSMIAIAVAPEQTLRSL